MVEPFDRSEAATPSQPLPPRTHRFEQAMHDTLPAVGKDEPQRQQTGAILRLAQRGGKRFGLFEIRDFFWPTPD